jgi:FMN-dependent NADH-azoreductase
MRLLHIDSSVFGGQSVTRELGAHVVAQWQRSVPGIEVIERDLAADPLPHLSASLFTARALEPGLRNEQQQRDVAQSDTALEEFLAADVLVIGAPMYNFGIPSQLKAWIDRIAIAGKTFRYTEKGPEGLAKGKRAIVLSARGGIYTPGTPAAAADFQEAYLRQVLGFLGITDIRFVRAEGVNMSAEQRQRAVAAAVAQIDGGLALAA